MLKVSNIDVYHGDIPALSGVSLEVLEGESVALIGGNGAGKTTFVNTICGLHTPAAGEISFFGERIDRLPGHKIVGLGIAQSPEGRQLFPDMTVLENLEMGAYKLKKAEMQEQLEAILEFLPRLKERASQKAGSLSGGEQQMVALGRAMISNPKLLILDEPSLGLAPMLVQAVFEKIKEANERGTTILLIEQNVQHSLSMADRAYVLENGRILKTGTGAELLVDPQIREAYLGI